MERLTKDDMGTKIISECGQELCKETCERVISCEQCPIAMAINKLAEYEDAEEEGLLLRLPCKVGTPVYSVESACNGDIYECRCECEKCKNHIRYVTSVKFEPSMMNKYGKLDEDFYLSKEEAEQALKQMGE